MIIVFTSASIKTFSQENITKKVFTTESFTGIKLQSSFNVIISQGETIKVEAEGDEKLIEKIVCEVKDNSLNIGMENGNYKNLDNIKVYVTTPNMELASVCGSGDIEINGFSNLKMLTLQISGSGNINNKETITCENLNLNINGSGSISANSNQKAVSGKISGSGDIVLTGKCESINIKINGSGSFNSLNSEAENVEISIPGSGNCKVNATSNLKVSIVGSGDIKYKGEPKIVKSITGSGNISKI